MLFGRYTNPADAMATAGKHLKQVIYDLTGAQAGDVNSLKLAGHLRKLGATHLVFNGVANSEANWLLHSTGTGGRQSKENSNTVRESHVRTGRQEGGLGCWVRRWGFLGFRVGWHSVSGASLRHSRRLALSLPFSMPLEQIAGHYLRGNTPIMAASLSGYSDPAKLTNPRLQLLAPFGHRLHLAMSKAVLQASAIGNGGTVHAATKHVFDCV